ncbi:MAG: hypothetical protein WCF23_18660 [Candidatus Nitrosopolaris sp.]
MFSIYNKNALTPYPPFGLTTISFFGLASYILLIGISSSAIYVAEDSNLRRSIRSFAVKKPRLLDSIGMAQMGVHTILELGWIKFNALKIVPLTAYQNAIEICKNLGTT